MWYTSLLFKFSWCGFLQVKEIGSLSQLHHHTATTVEDLGLKLNLIKGIKRNPNPLQLQYGAATYPISMKRYMVKNRSTEGKKRKSIVLSHDNFLVVLAIDI
jgi:hypothetical protein